MKTYSGINSLPAFKINGTNADLMRFLENCKQLGLEVSKANTFFRDDHEHCLMPAYSYLQSNQQNIKLQLLSSDVYFPEIVYYLSTDYEIALSMIEVINEAKVSA